MLKRLFNLPLVACAMFLAACEQGPLDEQRSHTEVELTFNFVYEDVLDTRAVSDGKSVDQLMYAFFTEDGKEIVLNKTIKNGITSLTGSEALTMKVTLTKGHKYKAVFWAQNSECKAYDVTSDMKVNIDYSGPNNDENRDAFFGVSNSFEVDGGAVTVTLKRPFAQLNAGTFTFDREYAKMIHGFDVTMSSVRIYDLPDEINLFDGSVSGSADAYFSPGKVPAESLFSDVDMNGENEEYAYLSMSYILAGEDVTTHSADFFFMDDDGKTVMFEGSGLNSVKLQRNICTDFVGQVLTDNGELNIRTYDNKGNTEDGSVYYRVSEDTVFENIIYDMSDHAAVQFGSENGQLVTYNNLLFTGEIWTIELGEYRNSSYVNYNNVLRNVEMRNLSVSAAIECHEWYFSPAVIAYGYTELYDCIMKGATTIRTPITDKHGVSHEVIPVDIGIRNESDAVISGGEYGTIFAWTHAVVNIRNAVIDMLYCGTCDSTKHSWMTIESGTKIRKIRCCEPRCPYGGKEYSTTMTIKKGAVVGELELVSTDVEFLIIEEGAQVGKIICEGVEYTYKELREAMGL